MNKEEQYFNALRNQLCQGSPDVQSGKMMSSEGITYRGKVFAFFSRQQKMVFKLGKDFSPYELEIDIQVFNPFRHRAPLNGWFEVPYIHKKHWPSLAERALETIKQDK